jgi:hypothetical protein
MRWTFVKSGLIEKKSERRFAASGACHLYLLFALGQPIQSGAGIFDAETYISTQQAQALKEARFPYSYEDEEWSCRAVAPPGQGPQACISSAGFPRLVFPTKGAKGRRCY